MKISDLQNEKNFRIFLTNLSYLLKLHRRDDYCKGVKKAIVEMNVENFYFYILKDVILFFRGIEEDDVNLLEKLNTAMRSKSNKEIMNFVRTKIVVNDLTGENNYQKTFEKVIPELFGYRFDLNVIKEKYDLFNSLYFNNELPKSNETDKIKFSYTNSNARKFGSFNWRYQYVNGIYKEFDYEIKINRNYKGTETRIEGTLIHEMIHFYVHYILKDYSNVKDGHGDNFMWMCREINSVTDNKYDLKRYNSALQHI